VKPCWARLAFILCLDGIGAIATARSAAGTPAASAYQASSVIPQRVGFAGTLSDLNGKPVTGVRGGTFALDKDQPGSPPLWLETRNVRADSSGHCSAMPGFTTADGLPADVFTSGDARWLGVQPAGQPVQARDVVKRAVCIEGRRRADLGGAAALGLHAVGPRGEPS
jgi:trimeric autotransporter adhesin